MGKVQWGSLLSLHYVRKYRLHRGVSIKDLADAKMQKCYRLLQCYPARYFGNPEGLEGSETKGFWTVSSAHALCLPSIVVQVFKVLASSEKYVEIPKNYFQKVRCFPKDSSRFWAVSCGRKLRRRLPEWM